MIGVALTEVETSKLRENTACDAIEGNLALWVRWLRTTIGFIVGYGLLVVSEYPKARFGGGSYAVTTTTSSFQFRPIMNRKWALEVGLYCRGNWVFCATANPVLSNRRKSPGCQQRCITAGPLRPGRSVA